MGATTYAEGLQAEYGWCVQTGQTDRAKEVQAELDSLGVRTVPDVGAVETAMVTPAETPEKPTRRGRK